MSNYHKPITSAVRARANLLVEALVTTSGVDPTDISLCSFPGNDGELLYGLTVDYNVRFVQVKDRRSLSYLTCERSEFFLNAEGQPVDDGAYYRHHRVTTVSGNGGFPEVTEEDIKNEEAEARAREIARQMRSEP